MQFRYICQDFNQAKNRNTPKRRQKHGNYSVICFILQLNLKFIRQCYEKRTNVLHAKFSRQNKVAMLCQCSRSVLVAIGFIHSTDTEWKFCTIKCGQLFVYYFGCDLTVVYSPDGIYHSLAFLRNNLQNVVSLWKLVQLDILLQHTIFNYS